MIEKANRFGTLHDPNKPGPAAEPRSCYSTSLHSDLKPHIDTFGLYNTDPTLAAADKENGGTLAKSTRSGHAQIDREKHKRDVSAGGPTAVMHVRALLTDALCRHADEK
jgi:hypothetical protein